MSEDLMAKITVFIPVRNGAQFIERAIDSVLSQTYQDFRLVILDNCSTDETRSLVGRYLPDNRIFLLERTCDVGMLGNFNDCLDRVATKYYMILCHDDFLCDNKALGIGCRALDEHPAVPAVYCETLFVDERDKPIANRSFGFTGLVENNFIAKKSVVACRNVYGVPLLIRTSALQDNRYDGAFPNSGDIDFSIAIGKGKNVYYVNDALIAIRFHKVNNTSRIYNSLLQEFLKIAEKHHIKLRACDEIRMKINDFIVCFKKTIFFIYLDKIRR